MDEECSVAQAFQKRVDFLFYKTNHGLSRFAAVKALFSRELLDVRRSLERLQLSCAPTAWRRNTFLWQSRQTCGLLLSLLQFANISLLPAK